MKSNETIKQLEALIKAEKSRIKEKKGGKKVKNEMDDTEKVDAPVDENLELQEEEEKIKEEEKSPSFWHNLLTILKAPFVYFAKYLKSEISDAIKNDIKSVTRILWLSLLFFSIIATVWITIQFCIYLYILSFGFTMLQAGLISIVIQLFCLFALILVIRTMFRNFKTLKLMKKIKETN